MTLTYLASLLRHAATVYGGYLIAKGQPELGGAITAAATGWALEQKRRAHRKAKAPTLPKP